ncbi:cyclase family protein, partial [bacterium]|nr:cyclase family protein [bacterium]
MTRRIIDLTLTMENAKAWIQFPRRFLHNHEAEEPATRIVEFFNQQHGELWWSIYRFETTTQSFTHMSSPKHFYRDTGQPIDQFPLEQLIGEAVVLDLSYKQPREVITAEDLDKIQVDILANDIIILRSDWTDRAWGTREFFQDMIGLSSDGADWLINKKIKALASDCRTDIPPFKVCT